MAEYIDRNLIEWYGCNFEEPSCENQECSGCSHAECSHTQVMQIPSADVIERSEYEKVLEENKQLKHIISDKVDKDLKCAFEVKELRSKIDKDLEQTYKVRDIVLHSNRMYEPNDVLEIIDEITACFERNIGE